MNNYEGVFLLNANASTEAHKNMMTNIKNVISKEGGSVEKCDEWGKRRLAYPIKKEYEASYVLVLFKINPLKMARIQNIFQLDEQILKFMIVLHDEKAIPIKRNPKPETEKVETATA